MSSENKVAIVVGASRGIGYASALALARAGTNVVIAARSESGLNSLAREIEKTDGRALALRVDVRSKKDIQHLVAKTIETFGQIDILVYSSGVAFLERTIAESKDEIFDETMIVNVKGFYWAMREVVTAGKMIDRKSGRIIVIGSDWGKRGEIGVAAYITSKHAVLGLVRAAAMEFGKLGITVNAVCPGYVSTKMAWDMAPEFAKLYDIAPEKIEDFLKSADPLNRISTPDEVADLVVFLALTAGGGATTGQGINIASNVMS